MWKMHQNKKVLIFKWSGRMKKKVINVQKWELNQRNTKYLTSAIERKILQMSASTARIKMLICKSKTLVVNS